MNKHRLSVMAVILSLLVALPAIGMGQHGPGGYGMGGWMMGYQVAPEVPKKLPTPKNQKWRQKLQDALSLERLSFAQYKADADMFNAHMPYVMVIPQEEDHVIAIEHLFKAYGLPATGKYPPVTKTSSIIAALELCVRMEKELTPLYEWLVQNAEDKDSAAIINEILLQTRHHQAMFEHALQWGGGMGPGMMRSRY